MRVYSALVLGSAVALSIGGVSLAGRVPALLTLGTFSVVVVLLILKVALDRGYRWSESIGVVLSVLAILVSASSPSHQNALLRETFSLPVMMMVLGFYLFPGVYLSVWIYRKIRKKSEDVGGNPPPHMRAMNALTDSPSSEAP